MAAQKSKAGQQSDGEKFTKAFLEEIDKSHQTDMTAIKPYVNSNFKKMIKHAEAKIKSSKVNEERAYWEWFAGYVHITSRTEMGRGYQHLENALTLSQDDDKLKCAILGQEAIYYDYAKEYDQEIEVLKKMNEIMVGNGEKPVFQALATIAKIYRHRGQAEEAIEYYGKAIEAGCEDRAMLAEQFYKRSLVKLRHFDDVDGAMEDLMFAMETNPDEAVYPYDHARLCIQRGRTAEQKAMAMSDCERVLRIDTVASLASLRHCALALMDKKTEAEEWIEQVKANYGGNKNNLVYIYYNKACVYALLGDIDEAMKWLNEAARHGEIGCFRLRNDADLRNLNGNPEFELMLEIACKR